MKAQVIGRIEGEERASFSGGKRQLFFVAQRPPAQFVGADHVELAQSKGGGNTPVDIFIQIKPKSKDSSGTAYLGDEATIGRNFQAISLNQILDPACFDVLLNFGCVVMIVGERFVHLGR